MFNPLNADLNPICQLLALLGAHHILHVSRTRVKLTSVGLRANLESYGDEKKNHLLLPGIVTQDFPARGTVTTPNFLLLLPTEIKYEKIFKIV